jgi:nicotinamide-nucleotide amidase
MRIELLCTGDELVTGQVTDTNSPWVEGLLLERLGARVSRVVLVGDVREHITSALLAASERADVVLVSGGLGPTADDFTAECAAAAAGVALVEDARVRAQLEERFARRGLLLTPNNLRQAQVPAGAEVVLNPAGTAPMFVLRLNGARLFFLPGVPRELKALVQGHVLPRLLAEAEAAGGRRHRAVRLLKTVGLPESHLDARVAPVRAAHPAVLFGFRTVAPENHLKLTAEADSAEAAAAALAAAEAAVRPLLHPHLFGADGEELAGRVLALLAAAGARVALVEAGTGGAVSQALLAPPGAEARVAAALSAAAPALLRAWVGVGEGEDTVGAAGTAGAVEAVEAVEGAGEVGARARALAEGLRRSAGVEWGLAVACGAERSGVEAEPTVAVAVAVAAAGPGGTRLEEQLYGGDRARVRSLAAGLALDVLRRALERA